jgi:nitric oxide reductase activation protein
MQTKTLNRAMPIVAAALGRKFGVNVIVGGTTASQTASTDGNTIWIPDLPADSALREVAWGFLAHEASHVRSTDMTVFRAAALKSPLQKTLLNILEDIRIEQAIRRSYPGTRKTLGKVVDWMIGNHRLCAPDPKDHPASILTGYLLLTLRCRVLEQTALTAFAAQAEKVLRQTFPASTVRRLMGMTIEVPRLKRTAEANQLAERILLLLKDEKQAAEQPQNDSKGGSEGDSKDSKGDSGDDSGDDSEDSKGGSGDDSGDDSEDSKGGSGDDSGDDSEDSKGGSGDDSEGGSKGGSGGGSGNDSGNDSGKTSKTLQQVLEAGEYDLDQDLFETAKTLLETESRRNGHQTMLPIGEEASLLCSAGKRLLHDVQGESRALTARLQGLVQSARMDRPYAGHQGKKLVAHRLHRAGVGDSRLFVRKTERTAPNTAVHLLIDLSGSMGNYFGGESQSEIAQKSALALALALDTIQGVSVAVTAFPGMLGEDEKVSRLIQHGQRPARRAGAFLQQPRGSTPLTQALWYAAADLLQRQARKRVILVMTDGKPDDVIGATNIIEQCQATGIEIAGIGIKIDVSWLFPRHIQIDSPADLKKTLFGLAEQFLV